MTEFQYETESTICALSSGRPPCGLAVIRISGAQTFPLLYALTGNNTWEHGYMVRTSFQDAAHAIIDSGYAVGFANPKTYTGEDCAEIHCHGSWSVIQTLLKVCCDFPQVRLALPGEFTRRSVLLGKRDLAQAQGILDLIHAETEAQRHQAQQLATGSVSMMLKHWREQLLNSRALVEACLEFPDETDDIWSGLRETVAHNLTQLRDSMRLALRQRDAARSILSGYTIAIVGAPNVGKSSLINNIAQKSVSIVTDTPGTTRDAVSTRVDLAGYPVNFVDTAGIRETQDVTEQIGVSLSHTTAHEADLTLIVVDGRHPHNTPEIAEEKTMTVYSHIDCLEPSQVAALQPRGHCMSNVTGAGILELLQAIKHSLQTPQDLKMTALAAHQFQRDAITCCIEQLQQCQEHPSIECKAEHLRLAAESLGRLIGACDIEATFDVLFQSFCIGK